MALRVYSKVCYVYFYATLALLLQARGLEHCQARNATLAPNLPQKPPAGFFIIIHNSRGSRSACRVMSVQSHAREEELAVLQAHDVLKLYTVPGLALRIRDASAAFILWQGLVTPSDHEQTLAVLDCEAPAMSSTEPPLALALQLGGDPPHSDQAELRLGAQEAHLCGGQDWSLCPKSNDIVLNTPASLGQVAFPRELRPAIPRNSTCDACNGQGTQHAEHKQTCPMCNGTGIVHSLSDYKGGITGVHELSLRQRCPLCGGYGDYIAPEHACPVCHGTRISQAIAHINYTIPASSTTGVTATLHGQGNAQPLHKPGDVVIASKVDDFAQVGFINTAFAASRIHLGAVNFTALAVAVSGSGSVHGLAGPRCLVGTSLELGVPCTANVPALGPAMHTAADIDTIGSVPFSIPRSTPPSVQDVVHPSVVHVVPQHTLHSLAQSKVHTESAANADPDKALSKLDLLLASGLFEQRHLATVSRENSTSSNLETAVAISILEAVSGFHAALPLPDGRVVHIVKNTSTGPQQVLSFSGLGLPKQQMLDLPVCAGPTLPKQYPPLPAPSMRDVTKVAQCLQKTLRCLQSGAVHDCGMPRRRPGGLAARVPTLQQFSFASASAALTSPTWRVLAVLGGCATLNATSVGADVMATHQRILARTRRVARCKEECQEVDTTAQPNHTGSPVLRWKPGWCKKQCPDIIRVYDAIGCVESMPQHHDLALGDHGILDAATSSFSVPPGMQAPCQLHPDAVHSRAPDLQRSISEHICAFCTASRSRYSELVAAKAALEGAQSMPAVDQDSPAGSLVLSPSAMLLSAINQELSMLTKLGSALRRGQLRDLALTLLDLPSPIYLLSTEELQGMYGALHVRVAVQYPTALDEEAQAALRDAFRS